MVDDEKSTERAARAAQMDERIARRPGARSSTTSGDNSITSLRSSGASVDTQSKTRTVLTELEADAKSKASSSPSASSVIVARTPPSRGSASSPGFVSEKGSGRTKSGTLGYTKRPSVLSNGGTQALQDLEDRIAYKTGIAIDAPSRPTRPEPEPVQEDPMVEEHSVPEQAPPLVTYADSKDDEKIRHGAIMATATIGEKLKDGKIDNIGSEHLNSGGIDLEDPGADLAVAIAVEENEDDKYIPSAIKYDPDAKPPLYKNRRFRLYSLLACSLVVVMIAGAIGLITQNKEIEIIDTEPTMPPTRMGSAGIIAQLELIVGSEVLNDTNGPHYRAKEWLINDDPMQLTAGDRNLVQRYLLAVFYFKLHEEGDWLSCNAPTEEESDDFCLYQRLANFYPIEYRSVAWHRWLSGQHECSWAGLRCDEFSQLRAIDLVGQEIKGTLPEEVAKFPFLQVVSLSWNQLHGSLPSEYGDMRHLLEFEVHFNELTGSLPKEWARSMNLQLLNLSGNQLTGKIPPELGSMSNLKGLFLFENMLSGTFPSEFGQLSLLTFARFHRNFLTGTIPTEIGNLNPREFWMHRMPLEGSIPSELGNMNELVDLRFHSSSISGTIPEEVYKLTNLYRIDLFNTRISGTLSTSIGRLELLQFLRLRNANMSGTIPTELASLPRLSTLWLDGNNFEGVVSNEICALDDIEEIVADCLPSMHTGLPQLNCTCCHICCDRATGLCDGGQ